MQHYAVRHCVKLELGIGVNSSCSANVISSDMLFSNMCRQEARWQEESSPERTESRELVKCQFSGSNNGARAAARAALSSRDALDICVLLHWLNQCACSYMYIDLERY